MKPTMKLPTKAPSRLPAPRITTISAGEHVVVEAGIGVEDRPPSTPPILESVAPSRKTVVNSRDTGMPTPRAISMSSTPARIIAPQPGALHQQVEHASAATSAIASTTSR